MQGWEAMKTKGFELQGIRGIQGIPARSAETQFASKRGTRAAGGPDAIFCSWHPMFRVALRHAFRFLKSGYRIHTYPYQICQAIFCDILCILHDLSTWSIRLEARLGKTSEFHAEERCRAGDHQDLRPLRNRLRNCVEAEAKALLGAERLI